MCCNTELKHVFERIYKNKDKCRIKDNYNTTTLKVAQKPADF